MEVVNMRDNVENKQTYIKKQEPILLQQTLSPPPPPPTATASPPSASSSPTHEFSFSVSLNPHPPPKFTQDSYRSDTTYTNGDNKKQHSDNPSPPPESLAAIDLSPADDIFFHGHLLPLHLLSHLPVSPRSSTNSMDSFSLPIKDILNDHSNPIGNTSFHYHHRNTFSDFNMPDNNSDQTGRPKSKSFSLFGRSKWKKGCHEDQDHRERNNINSKKQKLKQEVTQLIKRYMKMVRPLLSFPKAKRSNTEFIRQPHSFSGNLPSSRRSSLPVGMNRRRGEFSAPASMRTSPANSGILLASGTVSPTKSTSSDSTMEELQAAIQAAIAHCKNSIAMEDKIQSQN